MKSRLVVLTVMLLSGAARAQEPTPLPSEGAALAPEPSATAPAEPPPAGEPTPPPAPASVSAEPAEGDFAVDPSTAGMMVGEEAPKLELYGFADVSYFHPIQEDSIVRQYVAPFPTFFVGHLNVYLASNLSENWRSLAEVRFVYTPTGDEDRQSGDGTFPATDTTANDYAELQRTFQWGGIEISRVWLEYQPFDFLAIRAGQWLTPYGYWNDDHGSPTIIAVHKPFPIGDVMFPERQTGLMVHGKYFIDATAIGYALSLSNGRGPFDPIRDLDQNKAIGGRVYLDTTALGNLTLGVAGYRGQFTASTRKYRVDTSGSEPVADIYRERDAAYSELSLGADARWLWKGLHLQAEVMMNEAAYDDEARPAVVGFDPRPTFAADYRRVGAYVLAGFRTPFIGLMPYAIWEHSTYTNSDFAPPATAWSAGVNARPTPNVVLKVEYSAVTFDGVGSTGLGKDGLSYVGTQAAWAF